MVAVAFVLAFSVPAVEVLRLAVVAVWLAVVLMVVVVVCLVFALATKYGTCNSQK